MNWFRMHPYASALFLTIVLLCIGTALVELRITTIPYAGTITFDPLGGNITSIFGTPETLAPDGTKNPVINTFVGTTTVLPYGNDPTKTPAVNMPAPTDYKSFIAELIAASNAKGKPGGGTNPDISGVYAFIPAGLLTANNGQKLSGTQQALLDYGNQAGTIIHAYEEHNSNQIQVIKDSLEDRGSSDKAASVAEIGNDLIDVGTRLARIPAVPQEAASQNAALAKSYQDAGQNLIKVAHASILKDEDFVRAIQTYDTSVNAFSIHFTNLALIFSSYGVHFAQGEPGSLFSFSGAGN